MPEGAEVGLREAIGLLCLSEGQPMVMSVANARLCSDQLGDEWTSRASQVMASIPDSILLHLLHLLLLAQPNVHQAPCQILHALLVGELCLLGLVHLPYLRLDGVLLVHVVEVIEGLRRGLGKVSVLQQFVAYRRLLG